MVLNPVCVELSHNKILEQDEFEEDSFSENSDYSNSSFSITSKKEDRKKEEKSTRKVKKSLKKKLTKHIGSQMKALFHLSSLLPKTELEFSKKIINISNLSASKVPKLVEQKHKIPLHLRIPNSKKQVMERGSLGMKLGQLHDQRKRVKSRLTANSESRRNIMFFEETRAATANLQSETIFT